MNKLMNNKKPLKIIGRDILFGRLINTMTADIRNIIIEKNAKAVKK